MTAPSDGTFPPNDSISTSPIDYNVSFVARSRFVIIPVHIFPPNCLIHLANTLGKTHGGLTTPPILRDMFHPIPTWPRDTTRGTRTHGRHLINAYGLVCNLRGVNLSWNCMTNVNSNQWQPCGPSFPQLCHACSLVNDKMLRFLPVQRPSLSSDVHSHWARSREVSHHLARLRV